MRCHSVTPINIQYIVRINGTHTKIQLPKILYKSSLCPIKRKSSNTTCNEYYFNEHFLFSVLFRFWFFLKMPNTIIDVSYMSRFFFSPTIVRTPTDKLNLIDDGIWFVVFFFKYGHVKLMDCRIHRIALGNTRPTNDCLRTV